MSIWRTVKDSDIEVDHDSNEMDILIETSHNGNKYISITLEQLQNAINKLINKE